MPQHITPQRSVPITSQNVTRSGSTRRPADSYPANKFLARTKAADRLVDLAKPPRIDADPAEILHGIAGMRELPIQYRTHAIRADDQIAVAEIAMYQRRLLRRSGIVTLEPAQREFEYGAGPVKAAVFPFEVSDLPGGGHAPQLRQVRNVESVNARHDLTELARQHRTRLGELFVAKNLARDGLALYPLHDEACAEFVLGFKHMEHARRRQAGVVRQLHQCGLGIETSSARRRHARARRRAAQDRAHVACGINRVAGAGR